MFYKYYSNVGYGIQNLENKTICFSDIDKFNDPFEGIGKYLYDVSPEEQAYWDSIGSDLPKLLGERFLQESRDLLKFKNRIWCVTGSYKNALMWAHYANSHQGFCVGYTKKNIKKVCNKFEKIAYCSEPSPINIRGDINMDLVEGLLFQKDSSWKYEHEWRALYAIRPSDVKHLNFFDNLVKCSEDDPDYIYTPHGHAAFGNTEVLCTPRYILQECLPSVVYLGLRTPQQDRKKILEICSKQKISAFQMCQIPGSFKLNATCVLQA